MRACRLCGADLPLGPRPVLQADPRARLLIVGQAPGRRVHETGVPFNDPSGERLRSWLGVDPAAFYDDSLVALIPMGLCYPGRSNGGDAPPRPECAPAWRPQLMAHLRQVQLTIAAGAYAHRHLLGARGRVTDTVAVWRSYGDTVPIPHPSPRTMGWVARNPWFEADLLPELRARVARVLAGSTTGGQAG